MSLRQVLLRLAAIFRRERLDRELNAEMTAHLDLATEENLRRGMPPQQARRQAIIQFGGTEQAREHHRDSRGLPGLESVLQDAHFALRLLRKSPGFTLSVILMLALAIGANTAIFSIVNALMLKNLPYAHPERLGTIFRQVQGPQPYSGYHWITGRQWELLRDNVPALLSAVSSGLAPGVNLLADKHAGYVHAARISAHYLDVLEIHPLIGRNFSEDEDRPHGPNAVILSYPLWRSAFAANPDVVGQAVLLKGEPYTVIGVLAQNATTRLDADLYTALQPSPEGEGRGSNYAVITRLREGATWQQADSQINRAWAESAAQLAKQYSPGTQVSFLSVPLQKGETDSLRPEALALMLAAGFILLIACANLAGLNLAQMLRRTAEIATRMALGASPWQIQRQLWIESLLLALLGAAAGIGVGFLALRGLLQLLPQDFLPVANICLDGRVFAFTLVLSLLTSVLFGLLPALAARNTELRSSMTTHSVGGPGRFRLRQALIAGEVALTVVLLAATGLLIRTLIHLETLPPGFNPTGIMAGKASLDDARYHDPAAFRKLLDQSIDAMRRIPSVQNAAVGLSLPYERILNDNITFADGKEAGQQGQTDETYVTPTYFETLQIPLLAGRLFTASDGPDTQPVAIVDRTFARKFYHGADPIGRTLKTDNPKGILIVGEVADVQISSGLNPIAPLQTEETMYVPAAQMNQPDLALVHIWFQPSWIVRTAGPVAGLTAQMEQALATVDPSIPFSGFYSMSDLQARILATQRVEAALLTAMAVLALLLSAVGVFAMVANMVTQRTREIGIRIALGSTIPRLIVHIGRSAVGAAAAGLLLGLALCGATLPVMRHVLFGVNVYDAPTLLLMLAVLSIVALAASTIPALRIAAIDPAATLREE
jgi:macrolide transport system ATP-binding/permease protein